jgi:hypothetical protein
MGARDSHAEVTKDAKREPRAAPSSHLAGMLWFGGWLFTTGFLKLVWWKIALALVLWPYFLGDYLHP